MLDFSPAKGDTINIRTYSATMREENEKGVVVKCDEKVLTYRTKDDVKRINHTISDSKGRVYITLLRKGK